MKGVQGKRYSSLLLKGSKIWNAEMFFLSHSQVLASPSVEKQKRIRNLHYFKEMQRTFLTDSTSSFQSLVILKRGKGTENFLLIRKLNLSYIFVSPFILAWWRKADYNEKEFRVELKLMTKYNKFLLRFFLALGFMTFNFLLLIEIFWLWIFFTLYKHLPWK